MKTRTPKESCPSCGYEYDCAADVLDTPRSARAGDVSICISCGHIMVFAADLSKRELTDEEAHKIAGDRRILRLQKLRKQLEEQRK